MYLVFFRFMWQENISDVFLKYKQKFISQSYREQRLTDYEKAFGYTEETRKGSKSFCVTLGKFMEEVFACSTRRHISLLTGKGIDAESKEAYYQFKSRHDTMKQSLAVREIAPMLEKSIKDNKKFFLVVYTDKNCVSRDIPLHEGQGLTPIQKIPGYDPEKHRWVSDVKAYKHFFSKDKKKVKLYVLSLISSLRS